MQTQLYYYALLFLPLLLFFLYFILWRNPITLTTAAINKSPKESAVPLVDNLARITRSMSVPLTLARLPIDILLSKRNDAFSPQEQKMLFAIHRNLELLEELSHEINYGDNAMQLKSSLLHLPSLITEIRDSFDPMAKSMNIRFQTKLDLDPETEFLYVNTLKLEKIVLNLIINAFFNSSSEGCIILMFQTRQLPDGLVQFKCTVSDSGPAITATDLQHPERWSFRAGQSITGTRSSTNLILTLEIAQGMGGNLQATAPEEGGAAFTFELRCQKASPRIRQQVEVPYSSEYALPVPEAPFGTIHIVEANYEMRELLELCLDRYFIVSTYPSATTFLQFATKQSTTKEINIDVILIDLLLPDMDGMELLQIIRQHPLLKSLPLMALSTDCLPVNRLKALFFGVDDYIVKPIRINELRLRILNVMKRLKMHSSEVPSQYPYTNGTPKPFSQNILQTISDNRKPWMAQLLQLIETHLEDEQMSVSFLAKNMAVSKRQLFRIIKESTGLSPNQLIQEIRLDKALHLLEGQSDMSVSDVAYSIGMVNPSYFATAFKKRFNKSPSTFRK